MKNKHNPQTFKFNGTSFNEYFVAGKSLEEFIEYGKKQYSGRSLFGKRTEPQQAELLTEIHKIATEQVKKQDGEMKAPEETSTPEPEFTGGTLDHPGGKAKKPNKD